ncbi:MAG: SIMPL domain-containing protein [Sphingobium sp.]|nr:SIMPL domain-containing protein [Sphingobium sp.]
MKSAFALVALAASSLPMAAAAQTSVTLAETAPVVTLNITETVEAAPDMATVGTGVQTRAMTAAQAMGDNAAQMSRLVAALAKAGIDRKDIQTSGINLSPQYDYSGRNSDGSQSPPRFMGYEASNQLTVKLRDIQRVGPMLDRMVAAGATNLSGPTFTISDPTPMIAQARSAALRTARQQADFYAQATGYRSARLLSIAESSSAGRPPMPMMAMRMKAEAADTPVEPGQVSSAVTLTVQYALDK